MARPSDGPRPRVRMSKHLFKVIVTPFVGPSMCHQKELALTRGSNQPPRKPNPLPLVAAQLCGFSTCRFDGNARFPLQPTRVRTLRSRVCSPTERSALTSQAQAGQDSEAHFERRTLPPFSLSARSSSMYKRPIPCVASAHYFAVSAKNFLRSAIDLTRRAAVFPYDCVRHLWRSIPCVCATTTVEC